MDIETLLLILNLPKTQHVVVRRKVKGNIDYIGGGYIDYVIKKCGDLVISSSYILDDVLIIYVF